MKRYASLLCWVLLTVACRAETVVIGAEDDWYPYSGVVNGKPAGFAVDIVREAFSAAGIMVKFESLPYARCMAEAKAGKLLGCFNTARSPMLEKTYLWPDQPTFSARINVYVRSDSPLNNLTVKDLEGKTVGVTNDYEYGYEFDSNPRIKRDIANQDVLGLKKLIRGRFDYMLAYEKVTNHLLATYPDEFAGRIKPAGVIVNADLYVSFSKRYPDAAAMLARFNQGMAAIRKNKNYDQIEARWK